MVRFHRLLAVGRFWIFFLNLDLQTRFIAPS